MPSDTCSRLDSIEDVKPSDEGCHECLQTGGLFFELEGAPPAPSHP